MFSNLNRTRRHPCLRLPGRKHAGPSSPAEAAQRRDLWRSCTSLPPSSQSLPTYFPSKGVPSLPTDADFLERWRLFEFAVMREQKKTRRWRPWDMEMIVYGFTSKLSALQVPSPSPPHFPLLSRASLPLRVGRLTFWAWVWTRVGAV